MQTRSHKPLLFLALIGAFLFLFFANTNSADAAVIEHAATSKIVAADRCQLPLSGPWPDCATSGNIRDKCIIPAIGPWPSCATGASQPAKCFIPLTGAWPPCATLLSFEYCVIPASGPWPACARGVY